MRVYLVGRQKKRWRSDPVAAQLLRSVGCVSGSCYSSPIPGISEGGMVRGGGVAY